MSPDLWSIKRHFVGKLNFRNLCATSLVPFSIKKAEKIAIFFPSASFVCLLASTAAAALLIDWRSPTGGGKCVLFTILCVFCCCFLLLSSFWFTHSAQRKVNILHPSWVLKWCSLCGESGEMMAQKVCCFSRAAAPKLWWNNFLLLLAGLLTHTDTHTQKHSDKS